MKKKRKTRVICNAIIKDKTGKILLLKRASSEIDGPKEWEFPGGRLEFGEDPQKNIEREVKEETNLKVKVDRVLKILSKTYEKKDKEVHLSRIFFLCKKISGKIKLNLKEHEDYVWLSKAKLKKYNLSPYVKEFLKK